MAEASAAAPPPAPGSAGAPVVPPRLAQATPSRAALAILVVGIAAVALHGTFTSGSELVRGTPHLVRIVDEMLPPSFARWESVASLTLETAGMAATGASIGIGAALVLAPLASRAHSPHPLVHFAARGLVSFFRTVPDLVWAVLFVASVGLGPKAGVLTIVVDTIGFCGRFFADAMEESDPGPQEALRAAGAGRLGVLAAAVLPAALPSLVATSMFALEKAVRASVVLGLVGAGGIGIELKAAMDMFEYAEATTIILAVFALVVTVEQVSARVRRRIL